MGKFEKSSVKTEAALTFILFLSHSAPHHDKISPVWPHELKRFLFMWCVEAVVVTVQMCICQ